jgi:hypothetical protein
VLLKSLDSLRSESVLIAMTLTTAMTSVQPVRDRSNSAIADPGEHIWTRLVCKSFLRWSDGIETLTYIRPFVVKRALLTGHNGICASTPYQVIGLEWPCPRQVLKKLVSPVAPSLAARASSISLGKLFCCS